jgi:hypothetical protein
MYNKIINPLKRNGFLFAEFQYFLEVISNEGKGKKIPVNDRKNLIGRTQLHFDAAVSREHFIIKNGGETFHIRDLGAANRTILNGSPIEQNRDVEIKIGDVIRIGQTRLRLEAVEESLVVESEEPQEMPYHNKGVGIDGLITEPDKRGMDLNIGTIGTTFGKAIDKFRKLSRSNSPDIGVSKVREARKMPVNVDDIPVTKSSFLPWVGLILIVAISASAAAYFLN